MYDSKDAIIEGGVLDDRATGAPVGVASATSAASVGALLAAAREGGGGGAESREGLADALADVRALRYEGASGSLVHVGCVRGFELPPGDGAPWAVTFESCAGEVLVYDAAGGVEVRPAGDGGAAASGAADAADAVAGAAVAADAERRRLLSRAASARDGRASRRRAAAGRANSAMTVERGSAGSAKAALNDKALKMQAGDGGKGAAFRLSAPHDERLRYLHTEALGNRTMVYVVEQARLPAPVSGAAGGVQALLLYVGPSIGVQDLEEEGADYATLAAQIEEEGEAETGEAMSGLFYAEQDAAGIVNWDATRAEGAAGDSPFLVRQLMQHLALLSPALHDDDLGTGAFDAATGASTFSRTAPVISLPTKGAKASKAAMGARSDVELRPLGSGFASTETLGCDSEAACAALVGEDANVGAPDIDSTHAKGRTKEWYSTRTAVVEDGVVQTASEDVSLVTEIVLAEEDEDAPAGSASIVRQSADVEIEAYDTVVLIDRTPVGPDELAAYSATAFGMLAVDVWASLEKLEASVELGDADADVVKEEDFDAWGKEQKDAWEHLILHDAGPEDAAFLAGGAGGGEAQGAAGKQGASAADDEILMSSATMPAGYTGAPAGGTRSLKQALDLSGTFLGLDYRIGCSLDMPDFDAHTDALQDILSSSASTWGSQGGELFNEVLSDVGGTAEDLWDDLTANGGMPNIAQACNVLSALLRYQTPGKVLGKKASVGLLATFDTNTCRRRLDLLMDWPAMSFLAGRSFNLLDAPAGDHCTPSEEVAPAPTPTGAPLNSWTDTFGDTPNSGSVGFGPSSGNALGSLEPEEVVLGPLQWEVASFQVKIPLGILGLSVKLRGKLDVGVTSSIALLSADAVANVGGPGMLASAPKIGVYGYAALRLGVSVGIHNAKWPCISIGIGGEISGRLVKVGVELRWPYGFGAGLKPEVALVRKGTHITVQAFIEGSFGFGRRCRWGFYLAKTVASLTLGSDSESVISEATMLSPPPPPPPPPCPPLDPPQCEFIPPNGCSPVTTNKQGAMMESFWSNLCPRTCGGEEWRPDCPDCCRIMIPFLCDPPSLPACEALPIAELATATKGGGSAPTATDGGGKAPDMGELFDAAMGQ